MRRLWLVPLLALCLPGCGDDEDAVEETPTVGSEGTASLEDWVPGEGPAEGAAPEARPGPPDPHDPRVGQQFQPDEQPDNVRAVRGTIREREDAAGYTYFRVETEAGDIWIAAMRPNVDVGDRITAVGTLMQNFRSNSLNRTFTELLLAGRVAEGDEIPTADAPTPGGPGPHGGMPGGNPHGGMPAGNPHGGPPAGGNPHGGPPAGGNPHGGPPAGNPHGGAPPSGMPSGHP